MILAEIIDLPAVWKWLSDSKDAFGSLESLFKILGIIVGAWWAWLLFLRKRERYPRAKLTHEIQHWEISETHRLLRVTLTITNVSDVLLNLYKGHTWIQQMRPWPLELLKEVTSSKTVVEDEVAEIKWPLIKEKNLDGEREIEPGESDSLVMDFIIDKGYEQVLVYSWVENFRKPGRNIGWTASTVVNFLAGFYSSVSKTAPHLQLEGHDVKFDFSKMDDFAPARVFKTLDLHQSQDKTKPGDAKPPPQNKK